MSPVNHLSKFLFVVFPHPSRFHPGLPSLRVYARVYTVQYVFLCLSTFFGFNARKGLPWFLSFFCDEMPGKKQQERRRFRFGSYLKDKVYLGRDVTVVGTCG